MTRRKKAPRWPGACAVAEGSEGGVAWGLAGRRRCWQVGGAEGRGGAAPAGRGGVRGALPSVWWAEPNYK